MKSCELITWILLRCGPRASLGRGFVTDGEIVEPLTEWNFAHPEERSHEDEDAEKGRAQKGRMERVGEQSPARGREAVDHAPVRPQVRRKPLVHDHSHQGHP